METQEEELATTPLQISGPTAWTERLVAMLHSQRTNIREFLAARQSRIEQSIAQLEELIGRLDEEIEQAHTATDEAAAGAESATHDFQRRYEMALDDLRELKTKNDELQQQLGKAKTSVAVFGAATGMPNGSLDWETIKRRILASLESDHNEDDPEQQAARLKIEDIVKLTSNAIAEKNREIAALKRQLSEATEAKSSGVTAVAATVAANTQLFDADATILAERERLRQLQEQWKDKMRQAEIEVSLERAKLTRQRAEIEERLRVVESEQPPTPPPITPVKGAKPVQRWRVRLGLSDPE